MKVIQICAGNHESKNFLMKSNEKAEYHKSDMEQLNSCK